ncbi:hydrogenase 2 operon protein HybA [Pasteurella bettyae]|uniref:Putative Hydrogenase-2 operon protein HybA n=1 Tax=Pasteurella bettyae CCUG 2042 TaxID=1095749 RepID=I3DBR8_9PAST|nr:hydrogenase 2 operon protein HybA [Pasteurella bettyae]EIJ69161.1 putative Hydrogenase-2 operon protein HybA [Pasteurella bettyae CCUG 2042]SUB22782.1 formate dehydrogenase subunit beta [Pasteurella bettyae]
MDRRDFIKASMLGSVAAMASNSAQAEVKNRDPIPGALGMLYDSTLCVGCQACVAECQHINSKMTNPKGDQTWSNNDKLTPFTRNIIQVWSEGDGLNKDQTQNGYAYIKKQCMHCVDPNCVSVCPVQALTKDPKTGIVGYDPDICTGCRYCMVGCPFDVPKYDYNNPFGEISKCELCNQKGVERINHKQLPGCCDVCPTGAIIFGTREELMAEAKHRLSLTQGAEYKFPRQHINSKDKYLAKVPVYEQHIYGEKEGGGTQVLVLSGVPFENLGLPALDDIATGSRAAHLQHTLYRGMALPLVGLAGLTFMTYRNMHGKGAETHHEEEHHE